jgi:hypothetical protein
MEIDERAAERIIEDAMCAAKGDERGALALLQGKYIELAIRTVQEFPSDDWLRAMAAFCQTAMNKLQASRDFYSGALRKSRNEDLYLGTLGDPQGEGRRFAEWLYHRFQSVKLTQTRESED